ncbi:MAG: acyl-CoA synthetase [Acidimicrobiales bacterium]|nr:acyl-CoA synthetase [Acidimicrobiales bacterium]
MAFERSLQHQVALHPDRPAVIMAGSGEITSYAELDDRSSRMAHVLRDAGLGIGGHVALMMRNSSAFLEVAWAAQRAGLRYTALNSHLRADEVQHILDDCEATAFVVSADLADVVAGLDLSRVGLRIVVEPPGGPGLDGFVDYARALASAPPGPIADEAEGREMLYSSGTTGRPKGVNKPLVPVAPGDPASPAVAIAEGIALALGDDAVYLTPAPLYHAAPLVYTMGCHRSGATAVVMEAFDAAACLDAIERHRVTHAQFVPTMFTRLLRLPDDVRAGADVSSLRMVLHAAAPCPVAVKQAMMQWWGPILYEYYAGTEDIGGSFIGPDEWLAHPGSVGRPNAELHVLDADGRELGVGEAGTIWFAAGGRDFEYHNDPDKTAAMTNEHGWRTLGDVGYVDADGYLYLTDRSADMIVSGGVNIYPREAEDVLALHPAVVDVAVFGIPDDEMGEAVHAVVQLADPATPVPEAELLAWCRERLASYKCPRSIEATEAMPRDPSGKLFKRRLRDPWWEGRTSRIV